MRPGAGRRLLVVLLLGPVVELAVAIEIGRRIGTLPTVLALLALSAVGMLVLVGQGRGWMRALQQAAVTGMPPGTGADGARIATRAGAGILLALPGFVTGVLGLLLLVPPIGAGVRRLAARRVAHAAGGVGGVGGPGGVGGTGGAARGGQVVITGEVIEREDAGEREPGDDGPSGPPAVGPG
jgi:UPF0716 protein FxsA